MNERTKKLLAVTLNLVIASAITAAIVYFVIGTRQGEVRKCSEKPCYIALDKRLAVAEGKLGERIENKTRDRYTGQDAERDKRAMIDYINRSDERTRKEMEALRTEVNRRIDEMHNGTVK